MSGEVSGTILHCEEPVKMKGTRFGWSGNSEQTTKTMVCVVCDATLVLTITADVGPPEGVL